MSDVFLSYRNTPERRAFVRRLALLLRAHEVSVWWDYGLEAGESYRAQITEELSKAGIVVPLWCAESILSRWVLMEAELGKDKLVPARLQRVVPPQDFEAMQAADLTGWDGSVQHPRVLAFVGNICERLGKPNRAPIDMMEELSELRTLAPLPEAAPAGLASAVSTPQDVSIADLQTTWTNLPARDSSAAVERFLARVRGTAPGSGLEFEVEHALEYMRAEADRRELARRASEEAVRREAEALGAKVAEEQRRLMPGAEFRDAAGLPLMVTIPPGSFTMGSPTTETGRNENEGPQQLVRIAHILAVGKYPVTVGEWRKFVEATEGNSATSAYVLTKSGWQDTPDRCWYSPGFQQDDSHPVTCVSWDDASNYANWVSKQTGKSYRLLTEAEWEYACRAGTTTRYAFGDDITPQQANFVGTKGGTTPVGAHFPNRFGLADMHGNVWEWCDDCYRNTLEGQARNGEAFKEPPCSYRVIRGGSWDFDPQQLRSADRFGFEPSSRFNILGFRVARTLSSAP